MDWENEKKERSDGLKNEKKERSEKEKEMDGKMKTIFFFNQKRREKCIEKMRTNLKTHRTQQSEKKRKKWIEKMKTNKKE